MAEVQIWPGGHTLPTQGLESGFFQSSHMSSGPHLYLNSWFWSSFICWVSRWPLRDQQSPNDLGTKKLVPPTQHGPWTEASGRAWLAWLEASSILVSDDPGNRVLGHQSGESHGVTEAQLPNGKSSSRGTGGCILERESCSFHRPLWSFYGLML